MLFDWLIGMSLERTEMGRLGSDVGGVSGISRARVIVLSGFRTILRSWYGSPMGLIGAP